MFTFYLQYTCFVCECISFFSFFSSTIFFCFRLHFHTNFTYYFMFVSTILFQGIRVRIPSTDFIYILFIFTISIEIVQLILIRDFHVSILGQNIFMLMLARVYLCVKLYHHQWMSAVLVWYVNFKYNMFAYLCNSPLRILFEHHFFECIFLHEEFSFLCQYIISFLNRCCFNVKHFIFALQCNIMQVVCILRMLYVWCIWVLVSCGCVCKILLRIQANYDDVLLYFRHFVHYFSIPYANTFRLSKIIINYNLISCLS